MERFDFVVLGGGTAGLTASAWLAAAYKRTALIDPGPIGGLCALKGCNPKKILVRASEAWQEVRAADEHGVRCAECDIDWPGRLIAHNFLLNDIEPVRYHAIPQAVFTVPALAAVGLTEADARVRYENTAVLTDMSDWTVYRTASSLVEA